MSALCSACTHAQQCTETQSLPKSSATVIIQHRSQGGELLLVLDSCRYPLDVLPGDRVLTLWQLHMLIKVVHRSLS